jgi:hypothetical protein
MRLDGWGYSLAGGRGMLATDGVLAAISSLGYSGGLCAGKEWQRRWPA